MSDEQNDRQAAAAARAAHYESTTPPVGRVEPMGTLEERGAVGDFAYQVGVNLTAGVGVAGIAAAGKAAYDKITGQPDGKHEAD